VVASGLREKKGDCEAGINVADNSTTYLVIHVKCLYFCPIVTKFGFSRRIFIKAPQTSNFKEIRPL